MPRFQAAAALVQSANEVREQVVRALDEYLALSARMREFEDAFSADVLHAADGLRELTEQRRRLEEEYRRVRGAFERGEYASAGEVEDDVRAVLTEDADPWDDGAHAALPDDAGGWEPGEAGDDGLDEATRRRIVRDFKRIVLPAVHADTSDASFSVFEAAHAAYQARDHVLMEAFVIRYRGELSAYDEHGQAISWDAAAARLAAYRAAGRRLDARLRAVRRRITEDELNAPEHTRQRMREVGERIRLAVDEEAERVLRLRHDLEALVNSARNSYGPESDTDRTTRYE